MNVRYAVLLSGASLLVLAQMSAAYAAGSSDDIEEVVVTGTLIPGQSLTGSELTTVDAATITQLGVVDTSQLLSSLPQDTEFNNRPQVGAYSAFQTVNAPILRYLGGNSAGSNSTLLLVDGVRLPGMGIQQTSSDIDTIAPGALARVEAVPDGGSATYGSDAVGGVVNLITRKDFDGYEVGGHIGRASDYTQWDVSATAGKTWDNGSAWISYDYTHHDLILNSSRSYVHDLNYTTTPYTPNGRSCNPGNFISSSFVTYPIVNGAPTSGAPNLCDTSRTKTFFPGEARHSVMVGFDQDLTDWLSFDLRAYYMHRDAYYDGGPATYSGIAATYGAMSGTVSGSLAPSFGNHSYARTTLDTWGVIPKVRVKLPFDWQLVAFANFGQGYDRYQNEGPPGGPNTVTLAQDVTNGTFNPFTGLFASTPAGQAAQNYQANYSSFSSGDDRIANTREVFEGPLFSLPAGDVHLAVGFEYMREDFTQRNGAAERGNFSSIIAHPTSREITSGFGELSIPIVGENNKIPGIVEQLTLDISDRYDDYSDAGSTNNPKFALSWKPTSYWTIRGNWSTSFQAPSLASTAGAIPPALNSFAAGMYGGVNPAYPNIAGLTTLVLFPGGGINLKPQTATTWEAGTDITLPFFTDLSAGATYYNIVFTNRIGGAAFYFPTFWSLYPTSYVMNSPTHPLTTAQVLQYVGAAYNVDQFAQYINNPSSIYALENGLSQNLAATKTSGVDFHIDYEHATSFGSIFAGIAGTDVLTFATRATPTSVFEGLNENSVIRLRTSVSFGATVGDFLGKVTWNRTGGYEILPVASDAFQSKVDAFNSVNLALRYAPSLPGIWQDTSFNLNVDNVFDTNPPVYNGSNGSAYGYADFTLGRFIEVGIDKKF
jgi:iron complex outermembrane receptor protein